MPILIPCRLQCDASICINNQPQEGLIDLEGNILYDKKGGLEWRKSGKKLACSLECEQYINQTQPTGGGAPGKKTVVSKNDLRNG